MDLSNLNKEQREAVQCTEGPLLILAGAGSGKTSTMTHRIAYLIEEKGVSPYSILAVTFTNKAAAEMRSRVEELCGSVSGMWIMTFHAMCLRMLRADSDKIGFDRNFVIYDTTDQKTLVKNIIKEMNVRTDEYKVPYVLSVISDKKEKDITAAEFASAVDSSNPREKTLSRIYTAYQRDLTENNAMDFDDLLLYAYRLLAGEPEVLEKYRQRFRYIMVDEYQDTNRLQYKIVRLLAKEHRNICVVGDDDQCIYEWRGADIRNILDFENDFPHAKVVKLEQNYRSAGNILKAAHSVIKNNRGRKSKKLWTEKPDGDKITYFRAPDDKQEAEYIADQVEKLVGEGRSYQDIAILYRNNSQSRLFEQSFTARKIPYRVLSGLRYYDRKEIKDVMAYMRLVVNPKDELSFRRIINEPKRGIGPKTVEKLIVFSNVKGMAPIDAVREPDVLETLPAKSRECVKNMADAVALCRGENENLRVSDIYDNLLVRTGYLKSLEDENTVESEGRIENLMEFKSAIVDYETAAENPSLAEFMETLSLMSDIDNRDESEDAVVMMTMHSAKGLEFPVVFMPGMEDGLFPGRRSFDSDTGLEEERRLCYVGMTRAKEKLYLTGANVRTLYGSTDYTRESQFLREVDKSIIEGGDVYQNKTGAFGRDRGISGPGVRAGSYDGFSDSGYSGFRPYDALKRAKNATEKNASGSKEIFTAGDKVYHKKFGEGLVIDVSGSTVTVAFGSVGVKKMAVGIAPLKKL